MLASDPDASREPAKFIKSNTSDDINNSKFGSQLSSPATYKPNHPNTPKLNPSSPALRERERAREREGEGERERPSERARASAVPSVSLQHPWHIVSPLGPTLSRSSRKEVEKETHSTLPPRPPVHHPNKLNLPNKPSGVELVKVGSLTSLHNSSVTHNPDIGPRASHGRSSSNDNSNNNLFHAAGLHSPSPILVTVTK